MISKCARFVAVMASIILLASQVLAQATRASDAAHAMSEAELSAFGRACNATPQQVEAARMLFEATEAEVKQSEADRLRLSDQWFKLPADKRTVESRDQFVKRAQAASLKVGTLRAKLIADLKLLLTPDQQPLLVKFEYFLHRDRAYKLKSGWWIDRVNLLAIVAALKPGEPSMAAIQVMLDRYERELDPLLVRSTELREEISTTMRATIDSGVDSDAIDATRKTVTAPLSDINRRIVELNEDFASRVGALLSSEEASRFRKLYDQSALPESCGVSGTNEAIRAATKLTGLDDATKTAVQRLVDDYSTKHSDLTGRLARIERLIRLQRSDDTTTAEWDAIRTDLGRLASGSTNRLIELVGKERYFGLAKEGDRLEEQWRREQSK